MLTVEEALDSVLKSARPRSPRAVPLEAACGLVLAGDVLSDVDSPPFDKALMDGYAVRSGDVGEPGAVLHVVEEITAGGVPTRPLAPGQATRIMTGAPLPEGADAVVMIERTAAVPPESVRIEVAVSAEQNILRRGASMQVGHRVLAGGARLRPGDIGVLCEAGADPAPVHPRPRVAVLTTGNELVPARVRPQPGQIRNSNGPMLAAMTAAAGAECLNLGVARDEEADLGAKITAGLAADVLVLSGGVSMGVLDLVPKMLAAAGVQQVFHKIQLKPGKPLWFGIRDAVDGPKLVFGLPGNPVSSFVCFELFVRPAIRALAGDRQPVRALISAALEAEHSHRDARPTYYPAQVHWREGSPRVRLLRWEGSADLRVLGEANALAFLPPPGRDYAAGDAIDILLVD